MEFNLFNHDPNAVAIVDYGKPYTYLELKSDLSCWHSGLKDLMEQKNLQPGDRVFFQLAQDKNLVLAYYACLSLGLVAAPIFEDSRIDEIIDCCKSTEPHLFITNKHIFKTHAIEQSEFERKTQCLLIDVDFLTKHKAHTQFKSPQWPSDHPAILFFTSGSTGRSKAVLYTYETLKNINKTYQEMLPVSSSDRVMTALDLNGNAGFVWQVLPTLEAGATIDILNKRDGKHFYQAVCNGATLVFTMPWLGIAFLDYLKSKKIKLVANKLRYCLVGGDTIPDSFFKGFLKHTGIAPSEIMGMSETNIYAINRDDPLSKPGSAGLPVPGASIKIRDEKGEKPPNEVGEIWVSGSMLSAGYWNNPKETEKTLVDGWVKTGDLGYLDTEGYLYFSGRIKNIIINCGDNLYPEEIQNAIMQHPNVKCVKILGMPNERTGADVVAALTLKK